MARTPRNRQVQIPPRIKGFNPFGYFGNESHPVTLNLAEFEAIRLMDYEHLMQVEAAKYMNISRPTFCRVYDKARRKIATALNESRQIIIKGGKITFNGNWHECSNCKSRFNHFDEDSNSCPLCSSHEVSAISENL